MDRFKQLIASAKALLEEGKIDEAKAARAEAESVKVAMQEAAELAKLEQETPEPIRPPLPGASKTQPIVDVDPDTGDAPTEKVMPMREAAYTTRFGDTPSVVRSMLTQLHGTDYQAAYWQQRKAFNKYCRGGETALKNDERDSLRQMVFTPGAIKTALNQGVDDIATLRAVMVEASDTLGGYTVPVDLQNRIIDLIKGETIMRQRASVVNTSRDKVEMPQMINNGNDATERYTSPVRVRWVDETPSQLESQNLTFGMVGIPVHTSMCEAFLSRNLLEDTQFNIEEYLSVKMAEAAAIDEDDQFMFGDGVGKPLGLLPGKTNKNGLREVTSGSATAPFIDWAKLIAVPYAIANQYRKGSIWMGNRNTFLGLATTRNPESGDFYWNPLAYDGAGNEIPNSRLLGYSTIEQEAFPDIAANAYPMLFGDPKGYQIVDRVGMTLERFIDSPTARQNLVSFVFRRRLGGQPLEKWRFVAVKMAA